MRPFRDVGGLPAPGVKSAVHPAPVNMEKSNLAPQLPKKDRVVVHFVMWISIVTVKLS